MKLEDIRVVRGMDGRVLGITDGFKLIDKIDNHDCWRSFCESVASRLLTLLPTDDESADAVGLIKEDYDRLRSMGAIRIDKPTFPCPNLSR